MGQLRESSILILGQNTRGLTKDEHVEEFYLWFKKLKAWAATIQESWRLKDTIEEHDEMILINHGPPEKLCKRGSLGVAIALGKAARKAWEQAGSVILHFGLRILAIRLLALDPKGKEVKLFLVSAYAPVGAAPKDEREQYAGDLQRCINACAKDEVLIIGADVNASCGVRSIHDDPSSPGSDKVRGPFGNAHENAAGQELCSFMGANELCIPSTFFQHKEYSTWQHPCSKLWHQIDHWIVRQKDRKRVMNARVLGLLGKESDHRGTALTLRIGRTLKKRNKQAEKPKRIDRNLLKIPAVADKFCAHVAKEMAKDVITVDDLGQLQEACRSAAESTILTSERKQPGWFQAAQQDIEPTIMARNAAQAMHSRHHTEATKQRLKEARKRVKWAVTAATRSWLALQISEIHGMKATPANAWAAIKRLRDGKSITKKLQTMTLRKPDGELCSTPQENAAVMGTYLTAQFGQKGVFDPSSINAVRQRDRRRWAWMDRPPTEEEYIAALKKLGDGKSAADAQVPAEYYKVLEKDPATKGFLRKIILDYWCSGSWATVSEVKEQLGDTKQETKDQPRRSGRTRAPSAQAVLNAAAAATRLRPRAQVQDLAIDEPLDWDFDADKSGLCYEEWLSARMKLLAKKGDLHLCKNWRAVCLLDIASKVLSNVLVYRMQKVQEAEGLESQTGFRGNRGTIDGLFSVCVALQKRKEHNLATWALFIDLVKAFDSVSREALWAVLRKFGMPDHFISILMRLHTGAIMKFKIGSGHSRA